MASSLRHCSWALLGLLTACSGGGRHRPRSAVLITLDTTNQRALDVYGKDRGLTPNLNALAREAVVFDNAWTVVPMTLPAHSSILTGLYPPRHDVRDNGRLPLPGAAVTVAERAREAGVRTAAFIAAVVLTAPYGLDQGFELYDAPTGEDLERSGEEISAAAVAWLDARSDSEPFFLWAHYFDAHAPYEPDPEDLALAGGAYLGEVHGVDRAVGRLLDRLRRESDYDEMTIVVVADHGEALGRHGEVTHSVLIYGETMRVPLIVRGPAEARRGVRDGRLASVIDVAPTLLDGMGLSAGGTDGLSLLREGEGHAGVYLESYCGYLNFGFSPLTGWVGEGYEYLHSSRPELYDLEGDPAQSHDLFAPSDPRVEEARAALSGMGTVRPLERGSRDVVAAGERVDLRALGYADAASLEATLPAPLAETSLPAPQSRMAEVAAVSDAVTRGRSTGDLNLAIQELEEIVRVNPGNNMAQHMLGSFLVSVGRYDEAVKPLEKLVRDGHRRNDVYLPLARAYEALGKLDRARALASEALVILPGDAEARALLERLEGE